MDKNIFDSKEELHFSWYLDELKQAGYINTWERNGISYQLTSGLERDYIKPMKRVADKHLKQVIFTESRYTPDFNIRWTDKAKGIFVMDLQSDSVEKITTPFISNYGGTTVETKASFDMNNMSRLARNNIKVVWDKHEVYIELIKIPNIFNTTFTPNRYFATDRTMKPRKLNYKNVRTLREFIISLQK